MNFLTKIILFFSAYPFLISYFGSFIGGEETILIIAFLSGQKLFPFWIVFLACTIGTLSSDFLWFYFFPGSDTP